MGKILITGINGFIGSNLAHYFIEKGFIVYGTIRSKSNLSLLEDLNVNTIICDLNEIKEEVFPDDFDYIIHCAAAVSDFISEQKAKKNIYQVTVNLYEKVIKMQKSIKKLIYISTSLILGYKKLNISINNPGLPLKKNYYVYYKKMSEDYIIKNCQNDRFVYTILRPADVYGPKDRTSCIYILKAIENGFPVIVGKGNFLFPYCSTKTLCEATYNSILFKESDNKIYTVTSGISITWREFFTYFQNRFKKPQKIYIPIILAKIVAFILITLHRLIPSFQPSLTPYRISRITSNTSYDITETIKDLKISIDNDYKGDLEQIYLWYIKNKCNSKYY
ncbi:MAG: NAD-dependent epimerase/dehydratase family protein [Exilispira sp.]